MRKYFWEMIWLVMIALAFWLVVYGDDQDMKACKNKGGDEVSHHKCYKHVEVL